MTDQDIEELAALTAAGKPLPLIKSPPEDFFARFQAALEKELGYRILMFPKSVDEAQPVDGSVTFDIEFEYREDYVQTWKDAKEL